MHQNHQPYQSHPLTPHKHHKYEQYTPRKRYAKLQDDPSDQATISPLARPRSAPRAPPAPSPPRFGGCAQSSWTPEVLLECPAAPLLRPGGRAPRSYRAPFLSAEPATPRRTVRAQDPLAPSLAHKINALQGKIARLERMGPQTGREQCWNGEKGGSSQVTAASERESELLSRVSLGRLLEEQEGEGEAEVIQDLSYRISSRLRAIIRHFG